jgi:hypothetical protein
VNSVSLPAVGIQQSASTVCANTAVSFSATGAATYSWSTGSSQNTLTLSPAASTLITLTGSANTGCSNTATAAVSVNPLPVVIVAPVASTVCAGDDLQLTAGGADTYVWLPGNATTSVITVNLSSSVQYTVTGTDSKNCVNTASVSITVDPCTGVAESSLSQYITVYPNPSNGVINARFGFDGSKNVIVTNAVGAVIDQQVTDAHSYTADLSSFAKGIYFVKVVAGQSTAVFKVVLH